VLRLVILYHVRRDLRYRLNKWNVVAFKDKPTMATDTEENLRSGYDEGITMPERIVGRDLSLSR